MKRISFALGGMSCGHCVGAVDSALSQLDGVAIEHVRVGSATVAFDPETTTPSVIAAAIRESGYRVLSTNAA